MVLVSVSTREEDNGGVLEAFAARFSSSQLGTFFQLFSETYRNATSPSSGSGTIVSSAHTADSWPVSAPSLSRVLTGLRHVRTGQIVGKCLIEI